MIFSFFNKPVSTDEAMSLIPQIVDPLLSKQTKEKAMKRLDGTYRPKIQQWAIQWGMPSEDAKGMFGEIYFDLPDVALKITKGEMKNLDGYLNTMVRNKVCDYFNEQKKKPPMLTDAELMETADSNSSTLQALCKVEQTLIVHKALKSPKISEKCRQFINDYFYAETKITLKQIAEQNHETDAALRKRKSDCTAKFKSILEKMGYKDIHLLDEELY